MKSEVSSPGPSGPSREDIVRDDAVNEEQPYVSMLYERLDRLRARTAARLADLYRQRGSTHEAIWTRDAFVARDVERLERLSGVDRGLCFGRLDFLDRQTRYIGRIGLSDDDYEPLLIDWRAPAAEPFYRATAADPGDLARRRHIQTRQRVVTAVDDEVFALDALPDGSQGTLRGEAALMAALTSHRTGRMGDIVATIQAEQDRIIRAPLAGVLVVQGGPGTGKTVAALHRAAYLLYTHRDRLAKNGVLVVGPNRTFLRYIDQVLPSLGETGVVLAAVGELFPGVEARASEVDDVASVKGDPRMIGVIATAVRDRQRLPEPALTVTVDGVELVLDAATCRKARARARRSRKPHNAARAIFVSDVLTSLVREHAARLGDVVDDEDLDELRADLLDEPAVVAALDSLWPALTPQRLLNELFASPQLLASAGRDLADDERSRLLRPAPADGDDLWTAADVPLLDEAAELLGEIDDPAEAGLLARRQQEAEVRFAQELLDELELDVPVDAAGVAARYRAPQRRQTAAERAGSDRTWAFGHVIVDEAQELSPMAWRMIMRRAPGRSMTVVGDIAQTSAGAGVRSWGDVLDAHVPGRWRQAELTVNYRTPAEVMDVAAGVLAAVDPALRPPTSVRSTGEQPWADAVAPDELASRLAVLSAAEAELVEPGRVAVIAPGGLARGVYEALAAAAPETVSWGGEATALDAPVTVLTVTQAKGLEFDSVLVVEPARILAESAHGANDLYVAVTRPTQRLGVVHSEALPDLLADLMGSSRATHLSS